MQIVNATAEFIQTPTVTMRIARPTQKHTKVQLFCGKMLCVLKLKQICGTSTTASWSYATIVEFLNSLCVYWRYYLLVILNLFCYNGNVLKKPLLVRQKQDSPKKGSGKYTRTQVSQNLWST